MYFQTLDDEDSHVLSNPLNKPQHWLKTPTCEDVKLFETKTISYGKEAKTVRKLLHSDWLTEVQDEFRSAIGPVEKLSYLRQTREHIWPCAQCTKLGNLAECPNFPFLETFFIFSF